MKHLLLTIIKLYWLIPKNYRRSCLFQESCSRKVFRITLKEGLVQGFMCLKNRMRKCNPNYKVFKNHKGEELVLLNDGSIISKLKTTL